MLSNGHQIYVPEVVDYELRRELLRANKFLSVDSLNELRTRFRFLPISSEAMLLAAELWAQSRRSGRPTGNPEKLDIDVILAAQASTLPFAASTIVAATSNVGHIAQFVTAKLWEELTPE